MKFNLINTINEMAVGGSVGGGGSFGGGGGGGVGGSGSRNRDRARLDWAVDGLILPPRRARPESDRCARRCVGRERAGHILPCRGGRRDGPVRHEVVGAVLELGASL